MNLDHDELPYVKGEGAIENVIQSAKWILENAELFKSITDDAWLKAKVAAVICFDAINIKEWLWDLQFEQGVYVSIKTKVDGKMKVFGGYVTQPGTLVEVNFDTNETDSMGKYIRDTRSFSPLELESYECFRRDNIERMKRIREEMEAEKAKKKTNE